MHFPKFLRLALMNYTRIIKINSTTTIRDTYLDRVAIEIPPLLRRMYDFSYELLTPADSQFGRQLPDGNYTGMIGMLMRNEVDMLISFISATEEREKDMDFSYPITISHFTFITTKPDYTPEKAAFLKPFSPHLWITMIATLFLLSGIFFVYLRRRYTYDKILFAIFSSLLGQSLDLLTLNVKEHFLVFSYIISAVFLRFCYTCVLLSFITFPTFTGVRTIPELAAAVVDGRYQCVTYPGTFWVAALATSVDPNFRIIGRNLQQNQNEGTLDILALLKTSKGNNKKAFIGNILSFLFLKEKYFISRDQFSPVYLSMAFRKEFCCKEQVHRFVMDMWSSGIITNAFNRYHFQESLRIPHDDEENVDVDIRQFLLEDVVGAFFVLLAGYALSVAVFIFETISQCD